MKLPPLPQLPQPSNRDEAFRAGVRGAPYVIIDNLPFIPIVVSEAPGPNIASAEYLKSWPPAQRVPDIKELYRIGRVLRGIALVLDRWGEAPSLFIQIGQILLDHGAAHLQLNDSYGLDMLLEDYRKILRSLPDHVRRNESVDDLLSEASKFAVKHREWDEYDF